MESSAERVLAEALKLSVQERVELSAILADSAADEGVDQAWREEIARRLRDFGDGTSVAHDAERVREELQAIVDGPAVPA